MISNSESDILDECFSRCPKGASISKKFFTEDEILDIAHEKGHTEFDFRPFIDYLSPKKKSWCSSCNGPFSICSHKDSERTKKTVYILDPPAIAKEVMETLERKTGIEQLKNLKSKSDIYRVRCEYGDREIEFIFFSEESQAIKSNIEPLDLQIPVYFREFSYPEYEDYRFFWKTLLSDSFEGQLSERISQIKGKTTAVFAEYEEDFVSKHRTEIKKAIRDYFERSGYSVKTEVTKNCKEIERYGISAAPADYVAINKEQDEKILISHGEERDSGWYAQRFVKNGLVSVEDEQIFKNLQEQLDEKITYYKSVSNQLSSTSKYIRGLTSIVVVVTTLLTVVSANKVNQFLQSHLPLQSYSNLLNVSLLAFNSILCAILVWAVLSPYLREKLFHWKMYSKGAERPGWKVIQHSRFRNK